MNAADPVLDGCRSFLASIGETPDPALFADGDDTIDGGRRAAAQLLEQGVTAIFAANDQMALGAYQRAYALGLRIPEHRFRHRPLRFPICSIRIWIISCSCFLR